MQRAASFGAGLFFFCLFSFVAASVYGLPLSRVSDTISTSAPSATSSQVVQFTLATAVPAGGHITIEPKDGAFSFESGFDYTDVDVAVSNGGPFVDRSLADTANLSDDGVSVSGGNLAVTLNATTGLLSGSILRITLGNNASFGDSGDRSPINPSSPISYKIRISTSDAANTPIDDGTTMIAIVRQVRTFVSATPQPPFRVNGLPSGIVAAGNPTIELSLETNRSSTCRYSLTPNLTYDTMTNNFSSSGGTLFYTTVGGHVNGTSYTYYVRCLDNLGSPNTDDYPISFTLAPTPISNTSIAEAGSSGRGGEGPFPNGSSLLYLAQVTLRGVAPPGSTITTLKDGQPFATSQTRGDGRFESTAGTLERGAYTFMTYAEDSAGRKTASFSATLTLEQGTQNLVTDIVLSPTLALENANLGQNDDVHIRGSSIPNSLVETYITPQKGGDKASDVKKFVATSTASGEWSIVIPGGSFERGSYVIQARAVLSASAVSAMSRPLLLGIGAGVSTGNRSDLNRDGKVNLVDFSILLTFWNSDDAIADINQDGTVNLADFSIMLFNWTG